MKRWFPGLFILISLFCFQNAAFAIPANEIIKKVGIDQKLDAQIPLGLEFRDENGAAVTLGKYFGTRPVVLNLVYYQCPMLCGFVLNGLGKALRVLKFEPAREFEIISVSIDPKETPELARAKKEKYVHVSGKAGAQEGWHFLTGPESSIKALAGAVGFRYEYDAQSGQYAHAGGIMVLTPQGRVARYFYGIEYSPRDIRFALIEAAKGKIGTLADQLLLLCFHYDPMSGKYGFWIMNVLRAGGIATLIALGLFITHMVNRETHTAV